MEIRTGNIAPTSAISMTDLEVAVMANEQMQNENSYLGEQADKYKEWYQVAKERVIRLETKLEAYKEIVKVIIKDCKNV